MSEKKTILIVDDEVKNIDLLCQVLSKNYIVKVCKSGSKSIELAKKYLPDIILLDVFMPEICGFEVITLLGKDEITKNIPIMIMCDAESMLYAEKALLNGAVDYLVKPLNPVIVDVRVKLHMDLLDLKKLVNKN